jgi:acyl carrier protein
VGSKHPLGARLDRSAQGSITSETLMDEIKQAIHDYILQEFLPGEDPSELTEQTPLITGGILDSISTLKLVVFLEERFGVTVEAHEAGVDHLDSVGRIAQLISRKKHAA